MCSVQQYAFTSIAVIECDSGYPEPAESKQWREQRPNTPDGKCSIAAVILMVMVIVIMIYCTDEADVGVQLLVAADQRKD